jgi:hypothetical protein
VDSVPASAAPASAVIADGAGCDDELPAVEGVDGPELEHPAATTASRTHEQQARRVLNIMRCVYRTEPS